MKKVNRGYGKCKNGFVCESIHRANSYGWQAELDQFYLCSCEEAGADHLISVLSLLALSHRIPSHLSNFLLLLVLQVEAVLLVASHGQLVLLSNLALKPTVLESVFTHLKIASVLTALLSSAVKFFAHAYQSRFELIDRDFAVLIQIKLFHEHFDFLLKGREAVSLCEEVLDLIGCDSSTTIAVNTAEGAFELFIGEDVNAQCVDEVSLEGVRRAQRRYSKESH